MRTEPRGNVSIVRVLTEPAPDCKFQLPSSDCCNLAFVTELMYEFWSGRFANTSGDVPAIEMTTNGADGETELPMSDAERLPSTDAGGGGSDETEAGVMP